MVEKIYCIHRIDQIFHKSCMQKGKKGSWRQFVYFLHS